MREDICTIPVSQVFEEKDGCPICRMYRMLEERALEYIMGAAMMEPDVRIQTNRLGFCREHLDKMRGRKGGLQLALILESHFGEIGQTAFSSKNKDNKKISPFLKSCFICEKIDWAAERMLETIYITFEKDRDFREMVLNQSIYCLPHYEKLMAGLPKSRLKKYKSEFANGLSNIVFDNLKEIEGDLKHYCSMFDYRNSGPDADWGNSKTAIERAINFLGKEK